MGPALWTFLDPPHPRVLPGDQLRSAAVTPGTSHVAHFGLNLCPKCATFPARLGFSPLGRVLRRALRRKLAISRLSVGLRQLKAGHGARLELGARLLGADHAGSDVRFANGHVWGQPICPAGQAHVAIGRGPAQPALLLHPSIPSAVPKHLLQLRKRVSTVQSVPDPDRMEMLGSCSGGVFSNCVG